MVDKKIKPGLAPSQIQENSHKDALWKLLIEENLTFKGAKKRFGAGDDTALVQAAGIQYAQKHPELPARAVVTWAFSAYWEIQEGR